MTTTCPFLLIPCQPNAIAESFCLEVPKRLITLPFQIVLDGTDTFEHRKAAKFSRSILNNLLSSGNYVIDT